MNITDIKFRKIFPSGKLRAIVSVTFDDLFVVHDIKIIESQNGFFIAMPNRKTVNGEFKDICHPINAQAREMLETKIINAFDDYMYEMEDFEEGTDEVTD